jgi:dihydroxy-acid dehydratase
MTVTGRTLGENLERWTHEHGELSSDQDVIRPLESPIKETGHIRSVPDDLPSLTLFLKDSADQSAHW